MCFINVMLCLETIGSVKCALCSRDLPSEVTTEFALTSFWKLYRIVA